MYHVGYIQFGVLFGYIQFQVWVQKKSGTKKYVLACALFRRTLTDDDVVDKLFAVMRGQATAYSSSVFPDLVFIFDTCHMKGFFRSISVFVLIFICLQFPDLLFVWSQHILSRFLISTKSTKSRIVIPLVLLKK